MLGRELPAVIDGYLRREFGQGSTTPCEETDRPLRRDEVKMLSLDELVTIGNHTADHIPLTHLDDDGVREELLEAQGYLRDLTGAAPFVVAYPDGAHDADVVAVAREVGFRCGFTTRRRKERLPITADRLLRLGRFELDPGRDVDRQLLVIRSDLQLANSVRRALRRDRG